MGMVNQNKLRIMCQCMSSDFDDGWMMDDVMFDFWRQLMALPNQQKYHRNSRKATATPHVKITKNDHRRESES